MKEVGGRTKLKAGQHFYYWRVGQNNAPGGGANIFIFNRIAKRTRRSGKGQSGSWGGNGGIVRKKSYKKKSRDKRVGERGRGGAGFQKADPEKAGREKKRIDYFTTWFGEEILT